ncbi:MAG: hypothetical protein MMC23_007019 [Stictis urceolatum]|nr:hypothetical protein [Stictis urceolata]
MPRLNLDVMPDIATSDRSKLKWLELFLASMWSARESSANAGTSADDDLPGQKADVRVGMKKVIFEMVKLYVGSDKGKRMFQLKPATPLGRFIIYINSLKLDLVSRSLVLNCAAVFIPQEAEFHLVPQMFHVLDVSEDEFSCWNILIPVMTMLNCIDNSGASIVECVANLKMKRHAKIGDRIIVVVQKSRSFGENSPGGSASVAAANKVKRGDIRHAVVVRTAKKLQRKDGMVVRFDDNACVLIGKNGEPLGTRVTGAVGNELRGMQWSKILSLAPVNV